MGIELNLIHSKHTPKELISLPRLGWHLQWWNKSLIATIDKKALCISLEDTPPSLLKRIKALPKWSYEFDYAGKRIIIKYAPFLETLITWPRKGLSLKSLLKLYAAQMEELKSPFAELDQREQRNLEKLKIKS